MGLEPNSMSVRHRSVDLRSKKVYHALHVWQVFRLLVCTELFQRASMVYCGVSRVTVADDLS